MLFKHDKDLKQIKLNEPDLLIDLLLIIYQLSLLTLSYIVSF